ncbi:hydrolase, alpha/beta fold family protein [Besnoitia besnoiti]|uniref:Hydrolase, alpha/beta fold family protein n=1 Tax=Besnoitia besnoiti TaxID=94643 RepID=A0A2A9ME58_BESBE|nr:hydrolase, alpha/beta fold family protein [Besnoitia besnoiti]PFH36798.1 hydrolase, alpha/beta fold family protein [Besnoitia besnoiti]
MPQTTAPDWHFANEKGRFHVTSFQGHKLACVVDIKYPSCNKVAILCPGLYANKCHALLSTIAEGLPVNSIRFDFHGNGESEGDNDWSFGGYVDEAKDDLHAVVEACASYNLDVVCLIGHSRSATTVLLHAAIFDDVPLIVSLAGRYDMRQGLEKHLSGEKFRAFSVLTAGTGMGKHADVLTATLENDKDVLKKQGSEVDEGVEFVSPDGRKRVITRKCVLNRLTLDLRKYFSQIKNTKKILIIHGSEDHTVPCEDATQMANALPQKKTNVVIIEKASHSLTDTQAIKAQVVQQIENFIAENGYSCKKE